MKKYLCQIPSRYVIALIIFTMLPFFPAATPHSFAAFPHAKSKTHLHPKNLQHKRIVNLTIQGKYPPFSNLSHSILKQAHFQKVTMDRSHIDRTKMEKVTINQSHFRKASFVHSDLWKSQIKNSDFSHSSLNFSSLKDSKVFNTSFDGASLIHTDLKDTTLLYSTFRKANLEGANFAGANMKYVSLQGANLKLTHLEKARNFIWIRIADKPNSWITEEFLVESGAYYTKDQIESIRLRQKLLRKRKGVLQKMKIMAEIDRKIDALRRKQKQHTLFLKGFSITESLSPLKE